MDLIAINSRRIGAQEVQTVTARELHAFLEVSTVFTTWITRRIEEYGFVYGRDFLPFLQESSGGRPATEYAITLDMAKELSMVERNNKGREARAYFIDCERRAVAAAQAQPAPAPAELSRMDILRLAMESEEGRLKAEAALALAAPKVEFVDRYVVASTGALGFRQVAKLLGANEARFREWIAAEKIMYRLAGVLTPHQNHIDAGRFEVRTGEAQGHVFAQAKFSAKGVEWVAGEWAKHQIRAEIAA